jgi:predicted kinase
MVRPVGERSRNASDATADIVELQLSYDLGAIEWDRVDSSGSRQDTMRKITGQVHL